MNAMPLTPLFSVFFSATFAITLATFSLPALIFSTGLAAFAALAMFLVKGRYLPRWIMDILDRLSDKASLENAYAKHIEARPLFDAAALAEALKSNVVGQNAAIDRIAIHLRRRFAAKRPDKPVAVFCLAGPPGVGKTHLAKVLARELYADDRHLHFFDMSQFGQPHAAASLFGQARGYVGSTSYGALTAALRDLPDSVVLLDEFEKAHPEVHKRFLTAWNDGFVTETSDGARIPTNETVFILTTNAASRRIGEIAQQYRNDPDECDRLIKAALQDANFAPEVLSRIDQVFAFEPLTGLDIARVVALEIERLAKQFGINIAGGGIDPQILLKSISALDKRMAGGVRDIARALEDEIADGLIEARSNNVDTVRLVEADDKILVVPAEHNEGAIAPPATASARQ
jgi:ATP-dependent Clp protease ATP-binding subunit ClpA